MVLIKPDAGKRMLRWRARYTDMDTGKPKWEALPEKITTAEQREEWAVDKSKALAKRRTELEGGAPRATGAKLSDVIDRYFKAHPQLRARTLADYRAATKKLTAWAERVGYSADKLNRAQLLEFRESLIQEPLRVAAKGRKRGARETTRERRSPERVNSELRRVRAVLGYLVDSDRFARLGRDDLRRALKRLPVPTERIEYLKPAELAQLLQAALAHDAETYTETREEHVGERPIGTTPRYEPIAPLVAFVLLTGCRFDEALKLEWAQVDLDALDHDGRKVGEIHLTGAATKTHKARTIGLEVSPALRDLLLAMRPEPAKGLVFELSRGTAEAAAKRLRGEYDAPASFTWQALRRTCGTFLTNAPGIFGAASAYRSARQLGHSVQVAEKHYLGLVRGIPPTARTLESAMGIEDAAVRVVSSARAVIKSATCSM